MRRANESDVTCLAKLIDIAGEGIPNWLWSNHCTQDQTPLDIGIERAKRSTGGFSYTNALIAEQNGTSIGMVLSYPITEAPEDDPDDLPAPIAPFVALEKLSVDTWYVNALAVFAGYRSLGTGTLLLNAAEKVALKNDSKAMSIQVFGQNTGAVQLYKRLGFEVTSKTPVRSHPCQPYYTGDVLLLIKQLNR
ncbi:MAG: GNAT family N-acetyltransferase [Paracoccaceae bacterium]